MHAMPATRMTIPLVVAVSTVLALVLAGNCARLRPRKPRRRQGGALYARIARFGTGFPLSRAQRRREDIQQAGQIQIRQEPRRAGGTRREGRKKGAGVKKKATGPTTIDDVLDDIDNKLDLIKGISRPEACRKMVDTLSQDSSLTESDKKTLTELVGKLTDGR